MKVLAIGHNICCGCNDPTFIGLYDDDEAAALAGVDAYIGRDRAGFTREDCRIFTITDDLDVATVTMQ